MPTNSKETLEINTNWDTYLGDPARNHYSPLTQITRVNVNQLEVTWSYNSGELRGCRYTMFCSPLIVDGVLYGLSLRIVAFSLDAATGEELWRYSDGSGGAPQRGLMWWQAHDRTRTLTSALSTPLLEPTNDAIPLNPTITGACLQLEAISCFIPKERASSPHAIPVTANFSGDSKRLAVFAPPR